MTRGTIPTQIRLTEEDKVKIDEIRERYGLPSMASAIRYAVETVHRMIPPPAPTRVRTLPKKSPEKSK
jgi:hypothetical protein